MTSSSMDSLLSPALSSIFYNNYHSVIKEELKNKRLSEVEAESMMILYFKFVLQNGRRAKFMTTRQFSNFFHIFFNMLDANLIDAILTAIEPGSKKYISPQSFLHLMGVVLRGTIDDKIKLCFKIYDTHGSGLISRERLRRYYKNMVQGEPEDIEEMTNDFVEHILRKMDIDNDKNISFNDYAESVRKNPGLLEFLGKCIPDLLIYTNLFKRSAAC